MKPLQYYKNQNLNTEEDVFNFLLDTLQESIFTWDYFVNFEKVITNINKVEYELNILNSLIGLSDEEFDDTLEMIIENYPKVRDVLPLLIACRRQKIAETPILVDIENMIVENKVHLFNSRVKLEEKDKQDIKKFFDDSGLKSFLINKEVSNLVDFCKGIEVGMDTNGRKNRTGTSMESIIRRYLQDFCQKYNFEWLEQSTKKQIETNWNISIEIEEINRRFDFALRDEFNNLSLIEVNYYGSGGSKLKATAGEYKDVHSLLSKQNINFIWITDGQAWKGTRNALYETFLHNDYVFNLKMIADGILEEVLVENVFVK